MTSPPPEPICDVHLALAQWYRTPLGRWVGQVEAHYLAGALENTFGYYLLHYGNIAPFETTLQVSRVRRCIAVAPDWRDLALPITRATPRTASCCCALPPLLPLTASFEQLPFPSDSLDVVVLPHILDFVADPQQVLCEAERVLIPDGRLVLLGFNPLSSWGIWRLGNWRRCQMPWSGQWQTAGRLCEWLDIVGLQVERCDKLVYRPPLRSARGSQLAWLDTWGRRYWRPFGAVYAICAVKRVSALMPLRWRQRRRRVLVTGATVAHPTTHPYVDIVAPK
ncbi:class I SAM-dependent methyltransferase [Thiospirillum jenense]|uniref:Methyltransferase domain-containing protein n=1 Tax=Thiospirillum jenense TaxID=1653858 RepID=A0A839HE05_9GAMM|nr:class I SAM-dependent methyltransferase [Thiospirillum jenense]MBB1127113.1 methyltransferase domain-containing protein [Thiospirillum jenense]